jgi:RND superfamily putative drug exporter
VDIAVEGAPEGAAAQALVEEVRSGSDVLVGGAAAEFVDQQAAIASRLRSPSRCWRCSPSPCCGS